jgi:hypothetical protein
MTSTIRKTPGGGFGRDARFRDTHKSTELQMETPGPIYDLPGSLSDHMAAPLFRGVDAPPFNKNPPPIPPPDPSKFNSPKMPNPMQADSRAAWMIGRCQEDLAYYAATADRDGVVGPAKYSVNHHYIKRTNERPNFGQAETKEGAPRRGESKVYISKGHNSINLCTAGPGPKYFSEKTPLDFKREVRPAWGFGLPGGYVPKSPEQRKAPPPESKRASFLTGQVKAGYMYRAIPATNEAESKVNPQRYDPKFIKTQRRRSVQQHFGKAHVQSRMGKSQHDPGKIFMGKKFTRAHLGREAPAPIYYPMNGTIAAFTKKGTQNTPVRKWCP